MFSNKNSGRQPAITLAYVAAATSAASTIVVPVTAAAGDVAYLLDRGSGAEVPTTATPAGWTTVSDQAGVVSIRSVVSRKVLVEGDVGATITGMNATTNSKIMFVFRPSRTIVSATESTPNAQGTASAPTNQVVSASGQITPLVVIAHYAGPNGASALTTSFSTTADGSSAPENYQVGAYKIYNTAPADTTIGMSDSGTDNVMQSFYGQVS